jgi:ABC-2 type transport system ATP-binding protein
MSKNISELSRGNRQRVALAHALMNDPEILILDEPTSGLDPNQVEDVRSIIREIGKTRTVIVSTHILSEVETICSRAIIISGGKLVADSSIEELKNSIGTSSTVYITVGGDGNKACELVKSINGVAGVTVGPKEGEANLSELVVSVNGDAEIRPVIIKKLVEGGFDLYEAAHNKNTLEDVFHTLTEAK